MTQTAMVAFIRYTRVYVYGPFLSCLIHPLIPKSCQHQQIQIASSLRIENISFDWQRQRKLEHLLQQHTTKSRRCSSNNAFVVLLFYHQCIHLWILCTSLLNLALLLTNCMVFSVATTFLLLLLLLTMLVLPPFPMFLLSLMLLASPILLLLLPLLPL